MKPRYDTWPESITCPRCGEEYDAPSRESCFDSVGTPSLLCAGCQAKEDFFENLRNARWERAMAKLAGRELQPLGRTA